MSNCIVISLSSRFGRRNHLFAGLWFGKGKPHFLTFLKAFAHSICKLYVEGTLHIKNAFNNNYLMLDWKTPTGVYLFKHINSIVQETKGCKWVWPCSDISGLWGNLQWNLINSVTNGPQRFGCNDRLVVKRCSLNKKMTDWAFFWGQNNVVVITRGLY